jgi:bifunctional non-homologous end joining protein LigD
MAKDALDTYRSKRDFRRTAEPSGSRAKRTGGDSFVVQKHAARRLHYDFRLELDGVLLSWAVTRGPSYNPHEKRLAVRTEDHPLEYGGFEGTIPEGEYGGGSVIIWDNGRWEPHGDPREGLKEGKLKFALFGQRLRGDWTLVRMKTDRDGGKRENWLLIKERDELANDEPGERLLEEFTTSVVSGHTVDDIADGSERQWTSKKPAKSQGSAPKRGGGKAQTPAFVKPQLAELYDAPPQGAGWFHEIKFDGYRVVAVKDGGKVTFFSRSGLDWTAKFKALTPTIAALPATSAVIDGEVAVVGANNKTDFSALQAALSEGKDGFTYYVFDLLHLDGRSLTDLPLRERKARLKILTSGAGKASRLVYSDHVEGQGEAFFAKAAELGLEGIISKDAAAPYRSERSSSWRKIKAAGAQEFIIIGYSKSDKKGRPFSSLLLGYYDADDQLTYAGRVGTGYSEETLATLGGKLRELKLPRRPKIKDLQHRSDAVYVKPELVAQISFIGWTADRVVRHAVFQGLREDKPARQVRTEETHMAQAPDAEGAVRVTGVRLTSPDKLLYPDEGITKREVADYYLRVAERMMPFIEDRLISLVRCPQGAETTCFFQRHASAGFPEQFKGLRIKENNSDNEEEYIYIEDAAGLVASAQIGVLELHIWGSRVGDVERADRIVFDLDPDEGLRFSDLKDAAIQVRDMLENIGLKSFVMATGGKGLHLVCPVTPKYEWPEVKAFCRAIAETLASQHPDRYTANIRKAMRKGRIFVDYLRNDRTSTAICPYSTRNKPGATIAVPLTWKALKSLKSAHPITLRDGAAIDRLLANDPWAGYFDVKQALPLDTLLRGAEAKSKAKPKRRKRA